MTVRELIGPAGPDGGKAAEVTDKVKEYGAEKVYAVDDSQINGYLVAPKVEALQQLAEKAQSGGSVAAILVPLTSQGNEIGARVSSKRSPA